MSLAPHSRVWAHRGFSAKFPENTLAAFVAALELGVDGIELDIHLSKDGHIVVIHDEQLDRTTNGHGLVVTHTLAELQALDAGKWFSDEFAGARIPTLEEVLNLVAAWPTTVTINIESKSGVIPYPGLELAAWQQVCEHGLEDRVLFSSFNHFSLRDLKVAEPRAQIGLLYMEGLVDPWLYASHLNASALHPYFLSFDREVLQAAQEHQVAIHAFTVNNEDHMRRLLEWNVDAMITDRPDVLLVLRNNSKKPTP